MDYLATGVYSSALAFRNPYADSEYLDIESSMRTIFRRCVQCPDTTPSCPVCAADEQCSVSTKSCTACASSSCVKIGSLDPSPNPAPVHKAPVAGAIAGGVIGGIVVILLFTWLVWRFCIKRKREEFDETSWPEESFGAEKGVDQFTMRRDARASTHTVGSVASTVLTRASNIIQIAYIPGVTNRSDESSPDLLVPPVPPIPAASNQSSNASTPHFTQDQHFFMPGDPRDSTLSDLTDDARSFFARSSIAPSMTRSSVATTIYRNNAVINPVPAQTVTRAKAVAVSVNPSGKNSPTDTPRSGTPPLPTIDQRHVQRPFNTASPIVARIGTPKAVTVTKSTSMNTASPSTGHDLSSSGQSRAPLVQQASVTDAGPHNGASSTFDDTSSDEEAPHVEARRSLMGHGRLPPGDMVENAPSSKEPTFKASSSSPETKPSPFSSSSLPPPGAGREGRQHKHKKSGSLNQIIEEATRRASREPRHGGLGSVSGTSPGSWRKDAGPFSDEHIARTP